MLLSNSTNNFKENCVSSVKHTNICGLSINSNQLKALMMLLRRSCFSLWRNLRFNSLLNEDVAKEVIKSF